ncbi:MAG: hypothetical protein EP314_05290, partial [Bacteroidetes bacterium]
MNSILRFTAIVLLFPQLLLAQTQLLNQNTRPIPKAVTTTRSTLDPWMSQGSLGEKCLQASRTEHLKATNELYRQGWESARELTWAIADEISRGERATPPVYTI